MRVVNPTAKHGEDLATTYLQKQGYTVLERNFRKGYGEIDIVAIDHTSIPTLAFIEVKTRKSTAFGMPFEAITFRKIATMVKTAQYYKMLHPELPNALRIDGIAILLNTDDTVKSIELLKNISI